MNMVKKENFVAAAYNNNHLVATKSLSSLLRTYTQANLVQFDDDGVVAQGGIPLNVDPNSFNFDIGNVDYSPCKRDMADMEIHHILDDAMFKPMKKVPSTVIHQIVDQFGYLINYLF